MENWKAIKDWPGYEVSDHGRVRSLPRLTTGRAVYQLPERILRPTLVGQGYFCVTLYNASKIGYRYLHALVLTAFVGECPKGLEACHYDGDKANNRLENLRWDTRSANRSDSKRLGIVLGGPARYGAENLNAKLTDADVEEIRNATPYRGYRIALARKFSVCVSQISSVRSHRTWA